MIPELGSFSIIVALCFALIQVIAAIYGRYKKNSVLLQLSETAVFGQFGFLVCAMLCLIISFLNNDMTVIYVRDHSHTLLPFIYRVGAAWGGHEGSLLLWCLILSGWTAAFTMATLIQRHNNLHKLLNCNNLHKPLSHGKNSHHRNLHNRLNHAKNPHHQDNEIHHSHRENDYYKNSIIMILGLLSIGFIVFLFATSNPFARDFPDTLINGADLTPILQDPGLIFHPPMLYLGYVGFAIGFAFAISALLEGKFNPSWAQTCRPWIILPWSFLSCGIVLGSWWAYRELGWGGWWFWDPVENASLLPWLSATALIHSLIVSEKRDAFKGWTILLAIVTFTLSLLGTFLVRSGVLVSVHTFASDPTRGIFLLSYLALIIGGAFLLYALRIKKLYQAPHFSLLSRETFLLINSVILLTAVATIVIGTLYPIILDALDLGKISVGEPYFNTVFLPIMLPALLLMGAAPHVQWQQQKWSLLVKKLSHTIIYSILIAWIAPFILGYSFHILTFIGIALSIWIILATLQYTYRLWKAQHTLPVKQGAMIIAHLGIAILTLGITINKSYSEERQVKIHLGESAILAGYEFTFSQLDKTKGSNYESITATFDVEKNHRKISQLTTEQRIYTSHQETLSKPGVIFNIWRDLYLALGNALPDNSWAIRIYYKPFVRWIWAGGFMMLLGGILSLLNYWKVREKND